MVCCRPKVCLTRRCGLRFQVERQGVHYGMIEDILSMEATEHTQVRFHAQ